MKRASAPQDTAADDSTEPTDRPGAAPWADRVLHFGIGPAARHDALRVRDEMRGRGLVAIAVFRAQYGGWVVILQRGHLHRRGDEGSDDAH